MREALLRPCVRRAEQDPRFCLFNILSSSSSLPFPSIFCINFCLQFFTSFLALLEVFFSPPIVVRLREDRRTPLHSWRSRMCRESLRILAIPARILSGPWRFLLQSWLQNATAFANFNAKKFLKNHPKTGPKPPKSIKMSQNGPRSKKIAPRTQKDAKKHPRKVF